MTDWIRVEDKLPEEAKMVWFWVVSSDWPAPEAQGRGVKGFYRDGDWYTDDLLEGGTHTGHWRTTHWARIPSSPEMLQQR